jgi:hypothetical protein
VLRADGREPPPEVARPAEAWTEVCKTATVATEALKEERMAE